MYVGYYTTEALVSLLGIHNICLKKTYTSKTTGY